MGLLSQVLVCSLAWSLGENLHYKMLWKKGLLFSLLGICVCEKHQGCEVWSKRLRPFTEKAALGS